MRKRRKEQLGYVAKVVLGIIAVAGIVTVVAVVPKALGALSLFGIGKRPRSQQRYYINKTVDRLVKKGMLVRDTRNGGAVIRLTERGSRELARFRTKELATENPKRWDGTWYIIIYDIKEWRRSDRDRFRRELRSFGFVPIQQSVWLSPRDHEDIISLLKADYKIGKDILYIKAKYVEGDARFRRHFNLPST